MHYCPRSPGGPGCLSRCRGRRPQQSCPRYLCCREPPNHHKRTCLAVQRCLGSGHHPAASCRSRLGHLLRLSSGVGLKTFPHSIVLHPPTSRVHYPLHLHPLSYIDLPRSLTSMFIKPNQAPLSRKPKKKYRKRTKTTTKNKNKNKNKKENEIKCLQKR